MDFKRITIAAVMISAWTTRALTVDLSLPGGGSGRLHGFGQINYSARPDFKPSPAAEGLGRDGFLLAEERLQLKLEARSPDGALNLLAKPEFFHDAVDEDAGAYLREGYLDFAADSWGMRLGRQIVTWGIGDLVFINDFFPKDYAAFFSGRPLEYLKLGVDAAALNFSGAGVSAELVVIPPGLFTPDHLLPRGRFFQPDPFPSLPRQTDRPAADLVNTETALRIYRNVVETELSVYAYRGFWRSFALRPDETSAPTRAIQFFPELAVFGASARRSGLGGVCSSEIGFYNSRDDPRGDNPTIENSQFRFLFAYQRQIIQDFSASIEYYGELMQDYTAYRRSLPAGGPGRHELRDLIGLRLTRLLRYQTLKLSLFAFYSPVAGDYFFNPELSYQFTDYLYVSLGVNGFGGPADSFFGTLSQNDNIYLVFRYSC